MALIIFLGLMSLGLYWGLGAATVLLEGGIFLVFLTFFVVWYRIYPPDDRDDDL